MTTALPQVTPAPGVTALSGEPSGTGRCGDYAVTWRSPDLGEGGDPASVVVTKGPQRIFTMQGTNETDQLLALWCGDVTADDTIELAVEEYTGGAHCCFGIRVVTIEDQATLLNKDLGNAGGPVAVQLDDSKPLEITTHSDVLAYFNDISYAASPFLPLVFALRDGVYLDRTTEFPGHVKKSLNQALAELTDAVKNKVGSEGLKGLAVGAFGHYVLLDQDDTGLRKVASMVPDDIAEWLRANAYEAEAAIRG